MITPPSIGRDPRISAGRRLLRLFLLPAVFAGAPFAATHAQDVTESATTGEVVKLDNFVVTGYRRSLEASLDTKRNSTAIVDVITAEDVGKFPDTNVAESLSHVPGVTVDRLFGQGERVSILGTDPNLNRTLLNGQTVASGDWFILDAPSRQFNYTLLAPEVIGQAEVYKTPQAWLPEGSIGGTIMLHTRSPLAGREFVFNGFVGDMYNDRGEEHDFNFSNVIGWRNQSRTFGVMLGLQLSREHIRRDGVEALGSITAGAANPSVGGVGAPAPADSLNVTNPNALLPNAINAALFQQERQRRGGNIVVEYKPIDELKFEFNALKVQVDNDNFNTSYYVFPGWWRGAVVTNATVKDGIVDAASVRQNIGVMDLFYRKARIETEAYDGKATFDNGTFSLSGQGGYTKATGGTQAQYYIEPLLDTAGAGVGSTSYTFTGGKDHPRFTFDKTGVATDATAWTVGGPWWNGNIAADPEKDEETYGQIDGSYSLRTPFLKKVRGGLRYTDHSTRQDWFNISLTTLPLTNLGAFGPSLTPDNYLDGFSNITSDMKRHVMIDPGKLLNAVFNAPYGTAGQTMQEALAARNGFQPTQSFKVDEETRAAYVQADFEHQKLTGNVGLRYVETETLSSGYAVSGETVTPVRKEKTYDNYLPSLNLALPVMDDVVLRFGASQVIARPNYADLSSSVTLYDSIAQGVGGNPNLDPYKSDNLDLAAEWYFTKNSAFAVNLFYKDIGNYILRSNGVEEYFNQNRGIVTPYTISRPENAGSAKSQGASLYVQHSFANGFGVTANYTFVDASAKGGGELPFASEHQLNLSPYYEHGRFLFRVTYAWRSAYFTNVDRGNNVYTDDYAQLDANATVQLTKNFSFTIAAMNLLDETYYVYTKVPAKMFQAEYKNGRRVQAGVRWNF